MHNVLPMHPNLDPEPDVLAIFMDVVLSVRPDISPAEAEKIKTGIQSKAGGRRFYLVKNAKRPTPEQRAAMFKDGLTRMTDSEIIEKHQISKTTLWRIMKSGGGRFS